MNRKPLIIAALAGVLALLQSAVVARAGEGKLLPGHIPLPVAHLQPIGRLSATNRLRLAIGLPLRNPAALSNLLAQLYDPASPNFHQYLTPGQFAGTFGPSAEDYQAVMNFAQSNGLTVVGSHPNRTLLDVTAAAADVERVFHVQMYEYQHPRENRRFYAPDREPSPEVGVPLLHISGLDNYTLPHPGGHIGPPTLARTPVDNAAGGSGANGWFTAKDLRAAYVPGVSLNGSGQTVGLVEFNGFPTNDVLTYETLNHLPNVKLTTQPVDDYDGDLGAHPDEAAADIELVIAMAPGLSEVIVYECPNPDSPPYPPPNDLLSKMATDGLANQLSSSWFFDVDANTEQIFQQYAAQGQSFFQSSGDAGAYAGGISLIAGGGPPADDPYITVVGGTSLTTSGGSGAWASETVWNSGGYDPRAGHEWASGGGVSTKYAIPLWQQGVNMAANQGSSSWRNTPDVAMVATNIDCYYYGSERQFYGTSASAPLWAGFAALINQQAASLGNPPVGFLNPAIYAIGKGASYSSCFHDITIGNNTNPGSPDRYSGVPGYDLCTGWGTPNGASLINALAAVPRSLVWVAFGGSDPGNGSYQRPFNTLAGGINGVVTGGTIIIKGPGSTSETMRIAKPMTIQASGGSATIGR